MNRRCVLLIDQDEAARGAIALALGRSNYLVFEAPSAEEGLRLLAERAFDVICLDVMLSTQDGFEMCREVRRKTAAPIIAIGSDSDSYDAVAGLEAGADDFIRKPLQIPELRARIRTILRRVRSPHQPQTVRVGAVETRTQEGVVTLDDERV